MKILLIGGSGILGTAFQKALTKKQLDFDAPSSDECDITNISSLQNTCKNDKYSLIINCSGYTNVEKAGSETEKCFAINVNGIQNIIDLKIPLITFSTDYVFTAPENLEIPENFARNPQSTYAKSKAKGEEILENSGEKWWNIRTSWLLGGKGDFLEKVKEKEGLKIVNDQLGRPTFANDLAEYITENFILQEQEIGHYHLQNSGKITSWYKLAKTAFPEKNIAPISSEEAGFKALRPKNSVLKNTKLNTQMPNWEESLKEHLRQLK